MAGSMPREAASNRPVRPHKTGRNSALMQRPLKVICARAASQPDLNERLKHPAPLHTSLQAQRGLQHKLIASRPP